MINFSENRESEIYSDSAHSHPTLVASIIPPNDDEEITRAVIDAVRQNPCLYDPNHEHHGTNHASSQYRSNVWHDLAQELNFEGGVPLLQFWKRIRDRYVRERRRRILSRDDPSSHSQGLAGRLFDEMRWLDDYLLDSEHVDRNVLVSDLHQSNSPDMYYLQGETETTENDVMISGYPVPNRVTSHTEYSSSTVPSSQPIATKRVADDDCSPDSPGSEISVGSNGMPVSVSGVSAKAEGSMGSKAQPLVHSSAHGIQVQSAQSHSHSHPHAVSYVTTKVMGPDGSMRPVQSSVQMVGQIKKNDAGGFMLVDSGSYYGGSSQKVYRLVNVHDGVDGNQEFSLNSLPHSVPRSGGRKRIALVPSSQVQTLQSVQVPSSPIPSTSRGRLGDDLILDDGIQESTIVIDNHYSGGDTTIDIDNSESSPIPILEDSPGMSAMLIGGHQQMVSGSGGLHMRHMRSPSHHVEPQYSQYDADVAFQALIASHLNRLNDEDKAVMKLNIQRILLDARFGAGTCNRIIQDEELHDAAANSVVAHEMVATNPR